MLTKVFEITPNGDINEVATYALTPVDSLISYIIAYVLNQPSNLLNEDARNIVSRDLKQGIGHCMYYANNGNVYSVLK